MDINFQELFEWFWLHPKEKHQELHKGVYWPLQKQWHRQVNRDLAASEHFCITEKYTHLWGFIMMTLTAVWTTGIFSSAPYFIFHVLASLFSLLFHRSWVWHLKLWTSKVHFIFQILYLMTTEKETATRAVVLCVSKYPIKNLPLSFISPSPC